MQPQPPWDTTSPDRLGGIFEYDERCSQSPGDDLLGPVLTGDEHFHFYLFIYFIYLFIFWGGNLWRIFLYDSEKKKRTEQTAEPVVISRVIIAPFPLTIR